MSAALTKIQLVTVAIKANAAVFSMTSFEIENPMRSTTDSFHAVEKQAMDKQHKRALAVLLEKSVACIGIGAACLVAPSFLEPSHTAVAIQAGLHMGGWIAISVGVVLFCVRLSVQSKARKRASLPRRDMGRQESSRQSILNNEPEFPGFSVDAATPGLSLRSTATSSPEGGSK